MKVKTFFLLLCLSLLVFLVKETYAYSGFHKDILTCNDCHTIYPADVRSAEGNVNLCLSCHTGGAMASNLALYSIDQATITSGGVYGKSHRWDALAYQVGIATVSTITIQRTDRTRTGMVTSTITYTNSIGAKWFKDKDGKNRVACSSCHNSRTSSFIRNEKERDEKLCRDCHNYDFQFSTMSARIYRGKKMNHPFKTIGNNYVGCSSCHVIHAQ